MIDFNSLHGGYQMSLPQLDALLPELRLRAERLAVPQVASLLDVAHRAVLKGLELEAARNAPVDTMRQMRQAEELRSRTAMVLRVLEVQQELRPTEAVERTLLALFPHGLLPYTQARFPVRAGQYVRLGEAVRRPDHAAVMGRYDLTDVATAILPLAAEFRAGVLASEAVGKELVDEARVSAQTHALRALFAILAAYDPGDSDQVKQRDTLLLPYVNLQSRLREQWRRRGAVGGTQALTAAPEGAVCEPVDGNVLPWPSGDVSGDAASGGVDDLMIVA